MFSIGEVGGTGEGMLVLDSNSLSRSGAPINWFIPKCGTVSIGAYIPVHLWNVGSRYIQEKFYIWYLVVDRNNRIWSTDQPSITLRISTQ